MSFIPRFEVILAGLTMVGWRLDYFQAYQVAPGLPWSEYVLDDILFKSEIDFSYSHGDNST